MSQLNQNNFERVKPEDLVIGQEYWVQWRDDPMRKCTYYYPYPIPGYMMYKFISDDIVTVFSYTDKFYKYVNPAMPPGAGAS